MWSGKRPRRGRRSHRSFDIMLAKAGRFSLHQRRYLVDRPFDGLPGRTVTASPFSGRSRAFATFAGTSGPSVFFTTNGLTWSERASGLPPFSAQVIRFDPTDLSTLYVGTDAGVYRSTDSGATWNPFGTGMPAVSVYDIRILADGSILRAATHGRGIWELAVTGVTNHPPAASIGAPAISISVARGAEVAFGGSASDADGDPLVLQWTFPDDWSTKSGVTTTTHTFDRAGTWPVSLTATDTHGAAGVSEVPVTVTEPSDNCASRSSCRRRDRSPGRSRSTAKWPRGRVHPTRAGGGSCYPFQPQRTMWLSSRRPRWQLCVLALLVEGVGLHLRTTAPPAVRTPRNRCAWPLRS